MLVVHGGALHDYSVTNQVWIFNITEGRWWELDGNKTEASPHLFGHTGHVINDALLVLFGYSPHWDVSSFLFEMDLGEHLDCFVIISMASLYACEKDERSRSNSGSSSPTSPYESKCTVARYGHDLDPQDHIILII